jgi:hypothetical protein
VGELVRALLLPEVPRGPGALGAGDEAALLAWPLERGAPEGRGGAPDAVVVAAAHWVTTFHHYVAGAARFACPPPAGGEAAPGEAACEHPGHPALARALVAAGRAGRVPAVMTEDPALPLGPADLHALAPLLARRAVPIVPVSLCCLADLGETLRWGRAIGAAVREGPWRVVLAVCSPGEGPADRGCPAVHARAAAPGPRGAPPAVESLLGDPLARSRAGTGAWPVALLSGALGAAAGEGYAPAGPAPARGAVSTLRVT